MKILTQDLQFLVNKSAKAVGNSKLIPNTSWVKLIATNDLLTLVTNDSINTLYVSIDINNDEPFEAVVDANKFINLINKTTTSNDLLNLAAISSFVYSAPSSNSLQYFATLFGVSTNPGRFTSSPKDSSNSFTASSHFSLLNLLI